MEDFELTGAEVRSKWTQQKSLIRFIKRAGLRGKTELKTPERSFRPDDRVEGLPLVLFPAGLR